MTGPSSALVAPLSHRAIHAARRLAYGALRTKRELPTYFIVGAKRAGTTSLNEYIVGHPDVVRGLVEKGSRFFDINYHRGPSWFNRTLIPASQIDRIEKHAGVRPIYGESSPYYCFHPEAAARIAQRMPDARLIFLLREPAIRAWSHYRYEVARGFEQLPFIQAVEAEPTRMGQVDETKRDFSHRHHSYVSRSQYADQVARLHRHFDPKQVLILESESLFEHPRETMDRVFEHLGLRPYDAATYRVFKQNTREEIPQDAVEALAGHFDDSNARLRQLVTPAPTWS